MLEQEAPCLKVFYELCKVPTVSIGFFHAEVLVEVSLVKTLLGLPWCKNVHTSYETRSHNFTGVLGVEGKVYQQDHL